MATLPNGKYPGDLEGCINISRGFPRQITVGQGLEGRLEESVEGGVAMSAGPYRTLLEVERDLQEKDGDCGERMSKAWGCRNNGRYSYSRTVTGLCPLRLQ